MTKTDLIEKIKELGETEWEIVKDGLQDALHQFGPTVLAAAKEAVKNAATLALPGTAKKEVAFRDIGLDLAKKGIAVGVQVAVSMIYRMIETAYRWFKEVVDGITPGAPDTGAAIGTR